MKLDSATVSYVHRLASAFYGSIQETAAEFGRAFGETGGGQGSAGFKTAALLTWLDEEVEKFTQRVEKQVFSPSTPLEIIAASLYTVRQQSTKLQDLGLDVPYLMDPRFRRNVERTVWYMSKARFSTLLGNEFAYSTKRSASTATNTLKL